jgi:phosphate transport system protein
LFLAEQLQGSGHLLWSALGHFRAAHLSAEALRRRKRRPSKAPIVPPDFKFTQRASVGSVETMAQTGGKHLLPGFDQALESVKGNVLFMANLVSRNFANARTGFINRDEDFCAAVIADDEEVDLIEKQVDQGGTDVLMRFQPMVVDLRTVLVTVKLASHLERISDYCVSIARRTRHLTEDAEYPEASLLDSMFDSIQKLFSEAVASFNSIDLARAGWVRGQVEALARQVRELGDRFTDLLEERPYASRGYVGLMSIAESLEEIIYLCGTIAEDVIYIAEARDIRHGDNRLDPSQMTDGA